MDLLHFILNNGQNITGFGGLGYRPPIIGGAFELVKYDPQSKRNDIVVSYNGKPEETYPLVASQPTSFLWNTYLMPETSVDDKTRIIDTIEERKKKYPDEYEKTFNKYVKNLDQHKKEIVISSNEKTYELKNKYSKLFDKYFPKNKKQVQPPAPVVAPKKEAKPNILNKKRTGTTSNDLAIIYNNNYDKLNIDKKLDKLENNQNLTDSQKQIIKTGLKAQISYGLDLVVKNPTVNTNNLKESIDSLVDSLQDVYGDKYIVKISNNKLEVERIKQTNVKSDTKYKELVAQREDYDTLTKKEWKKIKDDDDNEEIIEKYDELELGDLLDKIEVLENGTYTKPADLEAPNCDEFEENFKNEATVKKFLKQTVPNFNEKNIKKMSIIHTETNYKKISFDGKTIDFKADKYFPMDVMVYIENKDGTKKKYAIELKFYDNTPYYTGKESSTGKVAESGTKVSFQQLCEWQDDLYTDYKKVKVSEIVKLKDKIETEEDKPKKIRDDKKISKLKKELKYLEELINDEEEFNEAFNKDIYGFCVAMKFSKGGFDFQNKRTDEDDYNDDETYKHLQKFNVKQNIIKFKNDGTVNSVLSGKNKTENEKYKLMKDAEVLYCVSMSDAILGLNYSQMIRDNNKLVDNPFYSHHLYKSSYGKYTDSIGLKLENFTLIK